MKSNLDFKKGGNNRVPKFPMPRTGVFIAIPFSFKDPKALKAVTAPGQHGIWRNL
jgi:hypothetical protein